MKVSCNGCRVLRKGCSDDCSLRPCLDWIENPESQGNAIIFLANFYGRTGLHNLLNAGPLHLRPALFRSLLHDACGRIVDPINGSVGLVWSGSWQLCQAAVDAVLKGEPITPITTDMAASSQYPPMNVHNIRHIPKEESTVGNGPTHRTPHKTRLSKGASSGSVEPEEKPNGEASPESLLRHQTEAEVELKLGTEPVLARGSDHVVVPLKKRKMGGFRSCHE